MREAFAQEAVLGMAAAADMNAPGAAVTVALCGHWEHEPPCPVAPHHTRVERAGDEVHVQVLFATEPEKEAATRKIIEHALSGGRLRGPDGVVTGWQLLSSRRLEVSLEDAGQAERLCNS